MKKQTQKTGRREFLQGALQALVVAPAAMAAVPTVVNSEDEILEEGKGPLPGEPGYRDPGAYGSIAD